MSIKKFFKKFAILVVVLVVLDYLIGGVFRHYYFRQKSGVLYFTTYVIDSVRADLLIFGSSRASHHYIPSVFENELHLSAYNCGRDGSDLIYSAGAISAVLERYTPKHIIIDFLPNELSFTEGSKFSPLLPYYSDPAVKAYINHYSKFERYKLLSKIYPYNSLFAHIVSGALAHTDNDKEQGFIKLDKVMPLHKRELYRQGKLINFRIDILTQLLRQLNQKHIKTTLVISPAHYLFSRSDTSVKIIEKLARRFNNVEFFNFENDTSFARYDLYQDAYHLNITGAEKFSKSLAGKFTKPLPGR